MTEKEKEGEISPIHSIIKKLKKEYDKDSKEWNVVSSTDDQGNSDTFIQKKPNTYWLKSKMLSPYSALSMGTVVRDINKEIDEQVGQTLSQEDMLRIFGMVVPIDKDKRIVASGIEKFSQHHGNHLKTVIKEKDPNIGYQMARKLDEEFTKRYPQRKNMYI